MTADDDNPPAPNARAVVAQILTAATELQAAIENGIKASVKGSSKPLERRPNKGTTTDDSDLQAFIRARIMTASVAADVAEGFAPEKHISLSALHRWWRRDGKHQPPPAIVNNEPILANADIAAQ